MPPRHLYFGGLRERARRNLRESFPETQSTTCAHGEALVWSDSRTRAAIIGLRIPLANAHEMTVRVTRDGALIAEYTFTLDYEVTPGPNGPDCGPPECLFAEHTLR